MKLIKLIKLMVMKKEEDFKKLMKVDSGNLQSLHVDIKNQHDSGIDESLHKSILKGTIDVYQKTIL